MPGNVTPAGRSLCLRDRDLAKWVHGAAALGRNTRNAVLYQRKLHDGTGCAPRGYVATRLGGKPTRGRSPLRWLDRPQSMARACYARTWHLRCPRIPAAIFPSGREISWGKIRTPNWERTEPHPPRPCGPGEAAPPRRPWSIPSVPSGAPPVVVGRSPLRSAHGRLGSASGSAGDTVARAGGGSAGLGPPAAATFACLGIVVAVWPAPAGRREPVRPASGTVPSGTASSTIRGGESPAPLRPGGVSADTANVHRSRCIYPACRSPTGRPAFLARPVASPSRQCGAPHPARPTPLTNLASNRTRAGRQLPPRTPQATTAPPFQSRTTQQSAPTTPPESDEARPGPRPGAGTRKWRCSANGELHLRSTLSCLLIAYGKVASSLTEGTCDGGQRTNARQNLHRRIPQLAKPSNPEAQQHLEGAATSSNGVPNPSRRQIAEYKSRRH